MQWLNLCDNPLLCLATVNVSSEGTRMFLWGLGVLMTVIKLSPIIPLWKEKKKNTLKQHPTLSRYSAPTKSLCSPTRQLKFPKGFPRILNSALALALAWESAKSTVAHGPTRVHLVKQPLHSWSTTASVLRNGTSRRCCALMLTQNVCVSAQQSCRKRKKTMHRNREEKNNSNFFY